MAARYGKTKTVRYRKIDVRIWYDDKFSKLEPDDKLIWLYLLTCPESTMIGLMRLGRGSDDCGLSDQQFSSGIQRLIEAGLIKYDQCSRLVWIPNWIRYNRPDGPNQLKGWANAVKEFMPHDFAKAIALLLWAERPELTQQQSIILRDDVKCVYCGATIETMAQLQLDQIARGRKYTTLVTACSDCLERKGKLSHEQFGFPFLSPQDYSPTMAARKLLLQRPIREAFEHLCNGLPAGARDIRDIGYLFETLSEGFLNPFETPSKPLRMQEQEQEQEQDQDQDQDQRTGSGKSLALQGTLDTTDGRLGSVAGVLKKCFPGLRDPAKLAVSLIEQYPTIDLESEITKAWDWENDRAHKQSKNKSQYLRNWIRRALKFQSERKPVTEVVDGGDVEPDDPAEHYRRLKEREGNF